MAKAVMVKGFERQNLGPAESFLLLESDEQMELLTEKVRVFESVDELILHFLPRKENDSQEYVVICFCLGGEKRSRRIAKQIKDSDPLEQTFHVFERGHYAVADSSKRMNQLLEAKSNDKYKGKKILVVLAYDEKFDEPAQFISRLLLERRDKESVDKHILGLDEGTIQQVTQGDFSQLNAELVIVAMKETWGN